MLQSIAERALGGLELALQVPTRRPERLPQERLCVPTQGYIGPDGAADALFTGKTRILVPVHMKATDTESYCGGESYTATWGEVPEGCGR